jgi:hypothetical protein
MQCKQSISRGSVKEAYKGENNAAVYHHSWLREAGIQTVVTSGATVKDVKRPHHFLSRQAITGEPLLPSQANIDK